MTASSPALTAEAWDDRYQAGTTGWDLGQPAPALVSVFTAPSAPPPGRLLVLGSGRGHDALWLAAQGFEVLGVDFAPTAIATAQATARDRHLTAQFLQRDIFTLAADFAQQFDYVVEHTCFCAIDPSLRSAYVQLVQTLLKPGGEFVGLFFTHARAGGPPFGSTPQQIRALFSPAFTIQSLVPVTNSVPARAGEEHIGRFQRTL